MYNIKVGITMGDPSGIGPLIIAKALKKLKTLAAFVVFGDEWVFQQAALPGRQAGKSLLRFHSGQAILKDSNIRFIDLKNVNHKNFSFGKVKAEYGRASIEYLDKALEAIRHKQIDCLVTCPISKEAVSKAGYSFSGHTEYLAKRTQVKDYAMLLLNKDLKISLVTRHIPLMDVPLQLNQDKIYRTIFLTHRSLKTLFAIKSPRIIVCGLNPHASDNSLIGKEENVVIKPALDNLRKKIKYIYGPISADVAIRKAYIREYDCVIAMYHDQALIPLKLLGEESGVNITLGLPFIRTSPLHGTAFDIAGTDYACPNSLIEAIKLSIRCTVNLKRN